jgi:hypothetical protein
MGGLSQSTIRIEPTEVNATAPLRSPAGSCRLMKRSSDSTYGNGY